MDSLTISDLKLIKDLSARKYSGNKLVSNSSEAERKQLKQVNKKLEGIAQYFANKYMESYGPFEIARSVGNPIAIGGVKFKRVWSGIYKGAPNKQYAAQISFVIHDKEEYLDVGFYFGRAAWHSSGKDKEQKQELEARLYSLATSLYQAIERNSLVRERLDALSDLGFVAYNHGFAIPLNEWLQTIMMDPRNTQITVKIRPNDFGVIENSIIDGAVSQIMFLMGAIDGASTSETIVKPLTPEQLAKKAELLARIGIKGELYALEFEKLRLAELGIGHLGFPKHVASISNHFGYDILSLDESRNEVYIEVKTTVRSKDDRFSKTFFLSSNELNVLNDNKLKYKLYRVYNVENTPELEILELDRLEMLANGYVVKY